jgi:hypothetical protein
MQQGTMVRDSGRAETLARMGWKSWALFEGEAHVVEDGSEDDAVGVKVRKWAMLGYLFLNIAGGVRPRLLVVLRR